MATEDTPTCHGCGRPNRGTGNVCEPCRQRAAEWLAAIPGLADILPAALIPGGTNRSTGEKTRKPDAAPLGINLGAFNLLAAGGLDTDPRGVDQVGVLPLRVWLDAWYDDWAQRYDFGPVRIPVAAGHEAQGGNPALMRHLLVSAKLVTKTFYGVGDGYVIAEPISDTLDAELAARFGRPANHDINQTVAALASRLDAACDDHEQIGDFLVGLRAMVGACRSVVGEHSDLTLLGRCPERRKADEDERCGGALWQDPYVSKIVCPRCKTEWVEKRWLWLGTMIRQVWPAPEATHAAVVERVVVEANAKADPPVVADRWWAVSCTCRGMEPERVRAKKIDARGRWRLHMDAVGEPALSEAS